MAAKIKKWSAMAGALAVLIGAVIAFGNQFWVSKEEHIVLKECVMEQKSDIRVVNTKLDNIGETLKEIKEAVKR